MCLLAKPKDGCKGKVWGCLNALLGFPAKSLMINSGYKILLVQQLFCIPLTKAALCNMLFDTFKPIQYPSVGTAAYLCATYSYALLPQQCFPSNQGKGNQ